MLALRVKHVGAGFEFGGGRTSHRAAGGRTHGSLALLSRGQKDALKGVRQGIALNQIDCDLANCVRPTGPTPNQLPPH